MKLLVQSDDYGITKAVSLGIIEAIEFGIVRNTGLFANMPWAGEVVEFIKPFLNDIAFGVDLNLSTGPALLNSSEIPSLIQSDGTFLSSSMNRKLDTEENHYDHAVYKEVYKEFEAQIQKYMQLVGKKPDYLHAHAYVTKTIKQVSRDLAKKYDVPYSIDIIENEKMGPSDMGWYKFPPTLDNQLQSSLKDYVIEDKNDYLNHEFGVLVCHCGYADSQLFKFSSFNLYRIKDLEAMTSIEVKNWLNAHHVELVTYKDIKEL